MARSMANKVYQLRSTTPDWAGVRSSPTISLGAIADVGQMALAQSTLLAGHSMQPRFQFPPHLDRAHDWLNAGSFGRKGRRQKLARDLEAICNRLAFGVDRAHERDAPLHRETFALGIPQASVPILTAAFPYLFYHAIVLQTIAI